MPHKMDSEMVRFKSLLAVNSQYETILSTLESLRGEDAIANSLLSFIEKKIALFNLELAVVVFLE